MTRRLDLTVVVVVHAINRSRPAVIAAHTFDLCGIDSSVADRDLRALCLLALPADRTQSDATWPHSSRCRSHGKEGICRHTGGFAAAYALRVKILHCPESYSSRRPLPTDPDQPLSQYILVVAVGWINLGAARLLAIVSSLALVQIEFGQRELQKLARHVRPPSHWFRCGSARRWIRRLDARSWRLP